MGSSAGERAGRSGHPGGDRGRHHRRDRGATPDHDSIRRVAPRGPRGGCPRVLCGRQGLCVPGCFDTCGPDPWITRNPVARQDAALGNRCAPAATAARRERRRRRMHGQRPTGTQGARRWKSVRNAADRGVERGAVEGRMERGHTECVERGAAEGRADSGRPGCGARCGGGARGSGARGRAARGGASARREGARREGARREGVW
jgi:hypothetical protein